MRIKRMIEMKEKEMRNGSRIKRSKEKKNVG